MRDNGDGGPLPSVEQLPRRPVLQPPPEVAAKPALDPKSPADGWLIQRKPKRSGGPGQPIHGRADEGKRLDAFLARDVAGTATLPLLITGERGVGKTHLAWNWALQASARTHDQGERLLPVRWPLTPGAVDAEPLHRELARLFGGPEQAGRRGERMTGDDGDEALKLLHLMDSPGSRVVLILDDVQHLDDWTDLKPLVVERFEHHRIILLDLPATAVDPALVGGRLELGDLTQDDAVGFLIGPLEHAWRRSLDGSEVRLLRGLLGLLEPAGLCHPGRLAQLVPLLARYREVSRETVQRLRADHAASLGRRDRAGIRALFRQELMSSTEQMLWLLLASVPDGITLSPEQLGYLWHDGDVGRALDRLRFRGYVAEVLDPAHPGTPPRYRVVDYDADRLRQSRGEWLRVGDDPDDWVWCRSVDYLRDRAEELGPGPEALAWYERERPQLRALLREVQDGDGPRYRSLNSPAGAAMRRSLNALVLALGPCFRARGPWPEAARIQRAAANLAHAHGEFATEARLRRQLAGTLRLDSEPGGPGRREAREQLLMARRQYWRAFGRGFRPGSFGRYRRLLLVGLRDVKHELACLDHEEGQVRAAQTTPARSPSPAGGASRCTT